MAKDDMHVVMYRILAYLYKCLRDGKEPEFALYSHEFLKINKRYWTAIMVELVNRGFVSGFELMRSDNETDVVPVVPAVTMEGVEFLLDNSLMTKARRFIEESKGIIPLAASIL